MYNWLELYSLLEVDDWMGALEALSEVFQTIQTHLKTNKK